VSHSAALERTPLVISAGDLICGSFRAPFREGDADSLLRNYLVAVREMRGQRRERTITLREDDLTTLAGHLGSNEASVLEQLLALMGATREQRTALLAMLAAGALTVVATGTIVLNVSADGVSADVPPVIDAGAPAAAGEAVAQAVSLASVRAAAVDAVVAPEVAVPAAPAVPAKVTTAPAIDAAGAAALAEAGLAPAIRSVLDAPTAADTQITDSQVSSGTGVSDDGSTVAVGTPPVPPADPGVGVDDSGATVAVAPPPVPPADTGVGVDDSGATVAVAPPPVPPADVGVGVDDSGATVAVAPPPVPPASP